MRKINTRDGLPVVALSSPKSLRKQASAKPCSKWRERESCG